MLLCVAIAGLMNTWNLLLLSSITNSKSTASSTKFGNRPTRSGNTKISHSNHHHMVVRGGNRTEKTI